MKIRKAVQEARQGRSVFRFEVWDGIKYRRLLSFMWSLTTDPPSGLVCIWESEAETDKAGPEGRRVLLIEDFEADDWEVL